MPTKVAPDYHSLGAVDPRETSQSEIGLTGSR